MALTPATPRQVPDHSIMDHFGKQIYLGNGFSIPVSASLSDTSETPILLITNPLVVSSGFPSGYVSQFIQNSHFTCTGNLIIRYYLNPDIDTMGTPSDPVQLRPANGNESVALVYASDQFTLNDSGTEVDLRAALAEAQALSDLLTVLDAGQSLMITAQTTASSTNDVVGAVIWNEF